MIEKELFGKHLIIFLLLIVTYNLNAQSPATEWNLTYSGDQFSNDALLDLSYLNEDIAGENGFVRLSSDSSSFETENGRPIRLWASNGGSIAKDFSNNEIETYAKFLAKMGVNMIRHQKV